MRGTMIFVACDATMIKLDRASMKGFRKKYMTVYDPASTASKMHCRTNDSASWKKTIASAILKSTLKRG